VLSSLMSMNPPAGFPRIVAHLIYEDVAGATEWLTGAFGFRERTSMRHTSPDGTVGRAQIEIVDSLITIGRPSIHADSPKQGVSSMLYVYVDDVDAHYLHAVAAGATIVTEIQDQPWGDRLYQTADPEGHQWTFAQHTRDAAPHDH
jgi:PhnB protein